MACGSFCTKEARIRGVASGKLKLGLSVAAQSISKVRVEADIKTDTSLTTYCKFKSESSLRPRNTKVVGLSSPRTNLPAGSIKAKTNADYDLRDRSNAATAILKTNYVDRFGGHYSRLNSFDDFQAVEKLYPSGDIIVSSGGYSFINQDGANSGLYASVDEGVFTGNYTKFGKDSTRITDDLTTYITPSAILTKADFKYKFFLTAPTKTIGENFLVIRAAAPTETYTSKNAPIYSLSNLRLEDPSGKLIVKYKDFDIKGDADYSKTSFKNFATYFSEPELDYTEGRLDEILKIKTKHLTVDGSIEEHESVYDSGNFYGTGNYPIFGSGYGGVSGVSPLTPHTGGISGAYTLNIDVSVSCTDDPFSDGFNFGFEDTCKPTFIAGASGTEGGNNYLAMAGAPLGTQSQSSTVGNVPTNNLRISAIEILSSGGLVGFEVNDVLNLTCLPSPTGIRSTRTILPAQVLNNDYNTTIYPEENTLWSGINNIQNKTIDERLVDSIRSDDDLYLELVSTSHVADSGKLKLKFSHEPPEFTFQLRDGAFGFGLDGFDRAAVKKTAEVDSFFVIDDIELKIIAKKKSGTRDYVVDVVGYSDDNLLHITPKVGGFLQNTSSDHPSGIGILPVSSGFGTTDELGIAAESMTDKSNYFESSGTNNYGGDHYALATGPMVSGLGFQEYTIPLDIYPDKVALGQSKDYSMSSFFESLYLDIYPFPSGAAVSHVYLSFTYKPSNALPLATVGHSSGDELTRAKIKVYPSGRQDCEVLLNAMHTTNSGLSLIENIPQGYTSPSTLKTNYSRRWRGVDGNVVNGPFDGSSYDFSFYNPEVHDPFLSGYYDFTRTQDKFVLSNAIGAFPAGSISGQFNGNLDSSIIENIGLRFNSSGLFPSTQQRSYRTIDWTPSDHELNGRILDSFDKAIRVSGNLGNLNFGSGIPVSSGFSAYVRFSPDITISGSSYNLWSSGVLLSKWDSGKGEEFSLGYSGGFLCGRATASGGNSIYIQDTQNYTNYQYPLSVLLTYNDNLSSGLKLYVDSEISSGTYNILRASSSAFAMSGGNSNIVAGYAAGSGVGINAFFTDVGLGSFNASGSHVVEDGNFRRMQQTTAESFFDQHRVNFLGSGQLASNDRYRLWKFVDEDVDKWHIGAFSICEYSAAYDRLKGRVGGDFINYNLKHHGSGYSQFTNVALPTGLVQTSGLAYHSQIENDMLRLNIATIKDADSHRLYSPSPRIVKSLPRGYNFEERAFVVETIIENHINNQVTWPDGKTGPKLIVSVYAPQKDPVTYTSGNIGLVNRHTHYLPQSGCWRKISSTFDYNDWADRSEPWSNFDYSTAQDKFDHEYYSHDIDKMFIQYDLAYPSGTAFDSSIKFHSINLKLEEALASGDIVNASGFTLYSSGDISVASQLDFFTSTIDGVSSGIPYFNLYSSGNVPPQESGTIQAFVNGTNILSTAPGSGHSLNLLTRTLEGTIGFNSDLATYGSLFGHNPSEADYNPVTTLYVGGKTAKDLTVNLFPLYIQREALPENSGSLTLFSTTAGNRIETQGSSGLLFIHGTQDLSPTLNVSMPLFVDSQESPFKSGTMPLYVSGVTTYPSTSGQVNLFTVNSPSVITGGEGKLQTINWTNDNTGSGLLVSEEGYAYLEANDEIRGVDLICFGNCVDSIEKCTEAEIEVHGEKFGGDCVDGGILRAKRLYTNLAASGFKTDVGYSGNFYGIRKYVGLIPNAPYHVHILGQTGSAERKGLPKSLSWEYGVNDRVNFSGIKLIADGIAGASGVTSLSTDSNRHIGDEFGKAVAVKGDYMLVGAPYHHLSDESGLDLGEAGTVFLYKREPQPTGTTWSYDKAGWSLDTKLHLPSGHRRDYSVTTVTGISTNLGELPFNVKETQWYSGQEGRQLGYSVDMSTSGTKPVIVAGAPSAKWTRTFDDPATSGVNVAMFVFTRELGGFQEKQPNLNDRTGLKPFITYRDIVDTVTHNNLTFKYFCNPSVELNVKVIVVEPISSLDDLQGGAYPDNPILDPESEGFLYKFPVHNHQRGESNAETVEKDAVILEELKQIFNGPESGVFPHDNTLENSGIPVIVGMLLDDSASMGEQATFGSAVDEFQKWIEEYSKDSGVVDIYNQPKSSYVKQVSDRTGEDWITQSNKLLDEILNTGTLFSTETYQLFANNLGTFRTDIDAFNIAAPSGGSVFVFQQESNDNITEWNVIQEIKSPTTSNSRAPDRFGHAVVISDDAQVIIVGSPYIQDAIKLYTYDSSVNPVNYVGNWIDRVGPENKPLPGLPDGYIYEKYKRYQDLKAEVGVNSANQILFDELHASGKFELRKNENIEQYKLNKTFTYNQFMPVGEWDWLYSKFVPTSRLGYSVAVNEDGSVFAAGAPTDSIIHEGYNDFNLWWRPAATKTSQWFSSVNAGSVRVFESRKYYPHSDKVVEFTKFGNLHRTLNFENSPTLFDHFSAVYDNDGKTFTRLDESEVDIPNDAGLAFIISPEIDALSDEILDNIQDWLGLGDRHLVIVGDDPKFEGDGAYSSTNIIVNDLLSKLGSRLTIVEASGDYAALMQSTRMDSQPFSENDPNVIASFVPENTTSAIGQRLNLYGSGVGDIKFTYPNAYDSYNCEERADSFFFQPELDSMIGKDPAYQDINDRCNIPIQDLGDMRSQWKDSCRDERLNLIIYPRNLALYFGTVTLESFGCEVFTTSDTSLAGYEPIPLLAAAEYVTKTRVFPAIADSIIEEWYISGYEDDPSAVTFADLAESGAAFYWSTVKNNYNSNNNNLQPTSSDSRFVTDDSDYILKAQSATVNETVVEKEDIADYTAVARETYEDTNSKVYLIGTTDTETLSWLRTKRDENFHFYLNLVQDSRVHVLNDGWTNRSTFVDGRSDSYLGAVLNIRSEDIIMDLNALSDSNIECIWIPNTDQIIPDKNLGYLKDWLSKGDRKLFISFGKTSSSDNTDIANTRLAATSLCEKLGLKMKPLYLPQRDKYAEITDFRLRAPIQFVMYEEMIDGYGQLGFSREDRAGFVNYYLGESNSANVIFSTAIDTRAGGIGVLVTNDESNKITDDKNVIYGVPYLKTGVAKVNFPVIAGSGYRLFFDSQSLSLNEKEPVRYRITNCNRSYGDHISSGSLLEIKDVNNSNNNPINIPNRDIENTPVLKDFVGATNASIMKTLENDEVDPNIQQRYADIFVPNTINNISIYIEANKVDYTEREYDTLPEATNIVGISGALLGSKIGQKPIWSIREVVVPGTPERTETTTSFREISTNSLKYCPSEECTSIFEERDPKNEIADGPIVAAQELYQQRPFDAGVAKSRITVLSDASLIQGKTIANEELVIHPSVIQFLRSLYPETTFPDTNQGRQYNIISRMTAPVKGSPQKFFNSTGNSGQMIRFAGDGTTPTSGKAMTFFSDEVDPTTLKDGVPLSVLPVDVGKGATYLTHRGPPGLTEAQIKIIKKGLIAGFDSAQYSYGGTSKFSGVIDGTMYGDAYYGNMPQLMADKGYDYLDFDKLPSGYPGDLFGYSIALRGETLVVGQPFGAFADERATNPVTWASVSGQTPQYTQASGTVLGYGGGAGSAYIYQRGSRVLSDYGVETQSKPWTLNQKFRPSSINVGQDLCLNKIDERYISTSGWSLGNNNYTITELAENSFTTDQFGLSVDLNSDLIVIGAPGHDFGNFEEMRYTGQSAFNFKAFNESVSIPERNIYDLGESGMRYEFRNSGIPSVLNAGAVYTFENAVLDWDARTKGWKQNQKLVAKGHNSRTQRSNTGGSSPLPISGCENDYFGVAVSVEQDSRSDSNYALAVGVPNHQYATSGNHTSFDHGSGVKAGAVYQLDAILRKPEDSVANTGIFIQSKVYGNSGINRTDNIDYLSLNFSNNGQYDKIHRTSGILYTNNEGELFLEASGEDPSSRGFITHRPFIKEITGKYVFGTPVTGLMSLFASGQGPLASGSMNLFNAADSGAIVYNNVGMYTSAVLGSASGAFSGSGLSLFVGHSGVFNSGLTLMASGSPAAVNIFNSGLTLMASGGSASNNNMFLRVRGK